MERGLFRTLVGAGFEPGADSLTPLAFVTQSARIGDMPTIARLCLLLVLISACDLEPEVVVNERILELDENGNISGQRGLACMALGRGPSNFGAGSGTGDFSVRIRGTAAGISVETSTDLEPAQTRFFSEAILRSGELQSFQVHTRAGKTVELRYWGSDRCEPNEVNGPQR